MSVLTYIDEVIINLQILLKLNVDFRKIRH